jgi:hypothetical protein
MRMPEERTAYLVAVAVSFASPSPSHPSQSCSPRYLLRPGLRQCWAGSGEFCCQYLGFLVRGNTKKKTGPTVDSLLHYTAYSSRLAVLCTNGIARPTSLGAGDPLACSKISRRTLTTTTKTNYHPSRLTTRYSPAANSQAQHPIRRDASEAARCTMNLRLDIIHCHFTLSDPHE